MYTCVAKDCNNTATMVVDGEHVCTRHSGGKHYVCKHCGVRVMGKFDFSPILGHKHRTRCPRRRFNS